MRIGILGGTFNPVHNGHLHIAKESLKKLRLDKVVFIPAYIPPHKKVSGDIAAGDRLKMLRAALKNKKDFVISSYELKQKGRSYSIKTAKHLKKKYGACAKLFFIIGSDSLKGLGKWKNIKGLRKILQFAVVPRPGFRMRAAGRAILKINIPKKDISSTRIRNLIKSKGSAKAFMPKEVHDYIKRKKIYS